MHYYSHHIGDYRRDTSALSMIEHGAYRLLMDEYYVSGKPLPLDVVKLCRIVRALSKAERDAVSFILSEFFTPEDDGFHQCRIDAEIEIYEQQRIKASEAGKASAAKRNAIKTGNARSTPVQRTLDSCTNQTATEGATRIQPPSTHEPITNNHSGDKSPDVGRTAARAAPAPADDEAWLVELESDLAYRGINIRAELGKMQRWCQANRKQPSRRRFINWINRAEKPMTAQGQRPPARNAAYTPESATAGMSGKDIGEF